MIMVFLLALALKNAPSIATSTPLISFKSFNKSEKSLNIYCKDLGLFF